MKQQIIILLVFFFLSLSFLSKAIEIKEGYWVGIHQKENTAGIFVKIEEWYFKKDSLSFQKYDEKFQPTFLQFTGKYAMNNNEFIIKDKTGEIQARFPILIQEDQIILTVTENSAKIFLYYNGEKSKPKNTTKEFGFHNQLFSINRPELFFNAADIEFWDYASFYSKDKIAQCHHEYFIFQFGKQHFIIFNALPPVRILKKENESFVIELLTPKREQVIFSLIHENPTLDMNHVTGKWKWKESLIKPQNINNHYTISIGYDVHLLDIKADGLIQWHTQLSYGEIQEKDPFLIPDRVAFFPRRSFPSKRKQNQYPFFKISPSGRLVVFESYPMESFAVNIGTNPVHHSQIMALQFLEKSDQKILFKHSYIGGKYITLTKVVD